MTGLRSAWALGLALNSGPPDLTEHIALSPEITVHAMISTRSLTPEERYVAEVCALNATTWTKPYGKSDVLNALVEGSTVHVSQNCDVLRIGFSVPMEKLTQGLTLMSAMLSEPIYHPDTFVLPYRPSVSKWASGYQSAPQIPVSLGPAMARQFWRWLVFSQPVAVHVQGAFKEGEAKLRWATIVKPWNQWAVEGGVRPERPRELKPLAPVAPWPGKTITQFTSEVIPPGDPSLPTYLMAANVLGVGKDSVMWRVVREELRLSYRQEAFLIADPMGWRFRLQFATESKACTPEMAESVKKELLKELDRLTGRDLARAIGVARGYFNFDLPTFPLHWQLPGSLTGSPADELYRATYWKAKTGYRWSEAAMLSSASLTRLEELKDLCKRLVSQSTVNQF